MADEGIVKLADPRLAEPLNELKKITETKPFPGEALPPEKLTVPTAGAPETEMPKLRLSMETPLLSDSETPRETD